MVEASKASKSVLAIDGGGYRGLACLIILSHVMRMLVEDPDDDPIPAPCEVFDLICGTSTGALIAILLGRLGLTCDEAIVGYKEIGPAMFGTSNDAIWEKLVDGERFSSKGFEEAVVKLLARRTGNKDALMKLPKSQSDPVNHGSTDTFVTVVSKTQAASVDATRVRSYAPPKGEVESSHKWTVFQALRAATASTLYFTPLEIPGGDKYFDAGASGFNNPSKVALEEMNLRFPEHNIVILSLGTGLSSLLPPEPLKKEKNKEAREAKEEADAEENKKKVAGSIMKRLKHRISDKEKHEERAVIIAKQMVDVATDTEVTHGELAGRYKREKRRQDYYRFNPTRGLGDLDIADYMKAVLVEEITNAWLKSPEGRAPTLAAANALQIPYDHKKEPKLT